MPQRVPVQGPGRMTTLDADSDERRLNVVMNGKVWSLLSMPVTALHCTAQ